MIVNLLATLLISIGIGSGAVEQPTATNFHNARMKTRDVETQRDETAPLFTNETHLYTRNQNTGDHRFDQKYTISNTNNLLNVRGNAYIQNKGIFYDYNDYNTYYWCAMNWDKKDNYRNFTEQEKEELTRFYYVIEITPYSLITDNEIEVEFQINMSINNANIIGYKLKEWYGTNNVDQYMKLQNTFTENFGYELEEKINQDFSLVYREWDSYTTAQTTETTLTINRQDLAMLYNTTNYYIWEIIPCAQLTNNTQNRIYVQMAYNNSPALNPSNRLIEIYDIESPINIYFYYNIPNGTTEVVNIPGLMFDILSMPLAFISQAFNLTLFPGTPYQVNISNLFLCIIAIIVFITIIKMILGR